MKTQLILVKRLFQFMAPYKRHLFMALFCAIVGTAINALLPLLVSGVIDYITSHISYVNGQVVSKIISNDIFALLSKAVVIIIVAQVFTYFGSRYITYVIQNTMQHIRTTITEKLNRLPVSFFDRHQYGDILSRITNDIDNIGNALQQGLLTIFTAVLTIILVITILTTISWQIMLLTILIIPFSAFVSQLIIKKSQQYFEKLQQSLGNLNAYIQEDYSGFNIIKLYGQEARTEEDFVQIVDNIADAGFKGNFLSALIMPLSGILVYLIYIMIAVLGGYYVIIGRMTIGLVQACTQYVWQINQPVSQIIEMVPVTQGVFAAMHRLFEILDESEETVEKETLQLPVKMQGEIIFEHVNFQYVAQQPLIHDLSFTAKKGETIAIVGPTGSGKTTLVNLLLRFYEINQGKILFDGISIQDLTRSQLRSQFGIVLQDAWLYQASIADNIRFGNLDATFEEIQQAAQIAQIDKYILSLPEGYDTILNEETTNVSQGQKQLITIARAILANPTVLILDEATSSVDTRNEQLIQQAMDKVVQGRTSFVIAHRLSTVRGADLILVIKEGAIIEQGTHQSLLEKKGFYEQLYNSQFADAE